MLRRLETSLSNLIFLHHLTVILLAMYCQQMWKVKGQGLKLCQGGRRSIQSCHCLKNKTSSYFINKLIYLLNFSTFNYFYQNSYELDKQILDTMKGINELWAFNLFQAGLRLMGLAIDANKLMKLYNENGKNLYIMYQNIPGKISKANIITTLTNSTQKY